MNSIKREVDSTADVQQHRPLKQQRIVAYDSSAKGVENIPLSPSIIEVDEVSILDALDGDAFEEPKEFFALDSADFDSVILLADESVSEIEKEEELAPVRCFR
jgi:hypothetical protein